MDEVRILEIKQSVFANNDQRAELLRRELKEKRIFLLNLMSSPGSGKTTTLTRTCPLYTSDAADALLCIDLAGCGIL